ncbi:MAG: glycosyltransferase family 4 protein, partial [Kiritimatiellae bacterium]|nr:glycosyltransferase family 4 protein [Kiritimatiellia bacterium]
MSRAQSIAFVCPRFSEQGTVGGAETLLKNLALRAAAAGRSVTFLTTCAESHFTWENTLPPGTRRVGGMEVHFFPADERDVGSFLRVQNAISNRGHFTPQDEITWIRNSVNSEALCRHLREHGGEYDRIVAGPYLFGITYAVSRIHPQKTLLVPCLHDEPFAYLDIMKGMFHDVAGFMFNTEPERDLARRLYGAPEAKCAVVGMGLDPFEADPAAFAARRGPRPPYVVYSGRREPLKGTPLLLDYVRTFRERTGRDLGIVFTGSGPIEAPPELEPHLLDLGFVSEQEKHAAMAGAVAFVHPSVNESLGIVLLESWLARTPALVHARSEVLRWQCARSRAGLWFR